ncbi:membrane protein RL12 [Human betaherpesvirus 5]|uniref:Membrane protein RL12 n=1 Tax=Human cytomegalovirus TaxID=10359 RepID=D7RXP4_HCMV|nr:RL12 protein [Human betaherpesvirus 5]ADI46771.1 RL12 protein [Human betaherpesvirus 5]AHV83962.1 membrane protein RL12 [Human betaherpesvirus 5]
MCTQHRRRSKSSYTQIICMFIIFWILQKGKCNNTTANTSMSTALTSLIPTTQLSSTLETTGMSTTTFTSSTNASTGFTTNSVKSTDGSSTISTRPIQTSTTNATVMTTSPNSDINSSTQHVTHSTVTLQTTSLSTNTTIMVNVTENVSTPLPICSSSNNTLNDTSNNHTCYHENNTISKEPEILLYAVQGDNITITHNLTTTSCYKQAWLRHFNVSTHGKYTHPGIRNGKYHNHSLKILHSRVLCEWQTNYLKHHYDLCFTCDQNLSLSLYGLNFTHSGKYSFRCYINGHPSEQNQNFNLQVHPRNNTNGTHVNPWICEEPKHEWDTSHKPTSHKDDTTTSTNHLYRYNNHSNTSHGRHTTWTLALICVACILLFFVRRALNKKYHPLSDDISESEFIVRYNPEHED